MYIIVNNLNWVEIKTQIGNQILLYNRLFQNEFCIIYDVNRNYFRLYKNINKWNIYRHYERQLLLRYISNIISICLFSKQEIWFDRFIKVSLILLQIKK